MPTIWASDKQSQLLSKESQKNRKLIKSSLMKINILRRQLPRSKFLQASTQMSQIQVSIRHYKYDSLYPIGLSLLLIDVRDQITLSLLRKGWLRIKDNQI